MSARRISLTLSEEEFDLVTQKAGDLRPATWCRLAVLRAARGSQATPAPQAQAQASTPPAAAVEEEEEEEEEDWAMLFGTKDSAPAKPAPAPATNALARFLDENVQRTTLAAFAEAAAVELDELDDIINGGDPTVAFMDAIAAHFNTPDNPCTGLDIQHMYLTD